MKEIIITGPPRTGTTALCYLLNSAPNVLVPDETGAYHSLDGDMSERLNAIFRWPKNQAILKAKSIDPDDLLMEIMNKHYTGRMLQDHLASVAGITVIGDKYPTYISNILDWIFDMPDITLFVCIRDPLAVVASLLRNYQVPNKPWGTNSYKQACDVTMMWFQFVLPVIRNEDLSHRRFVVRYDEMVEAIEKHVNVFAEILDLNIQDIDLSIYQPTNVNAWERELDFSMITPSIYHMRKILGYL